MFKHRQLTTAAVFSVLVVAATASAPRAVAGETPITGSGTIRLSGSDRYATAVAISRKVFSPPQDVYVASGEDFPDALAVGPLAGRGIPNPILLVRRTQLPGTTRAELQRLAPQNVTIVGGRAAIAESVAQAIAAAVPAARVTRIDGANRYDTAAIIAEQMAAVQPWDRMVLVSGQNFPDAMAAGPLAAGFRGPLLLTGRDQLPPETGRVLQSVHPTTIWIVGGPGVVSESVVSQLRDDFSVTEVNRVWGPDRYATAERVAQTFGPQRRQSVVLASGTNFPDALAVVPVAAAQPLSGDFGGAPILFTQSNCMPADTGRFLSGNQPLLRIVVGGVAVAYGGERRCVP